MLNVPFIDMLSRGATWFVRLCLSSIESLIGLIWGLAQHNPLFLDDRIAFHLTLMVIGILIVVAVINWQYAGEIVTLLLTTVLIGNIALTLYRSDSRAKWETLSYAQALFVIIPVVYLMTYNAGRLKHKPKLNTGAIRRDYVLCGLLYWGTLMSVTVVIDRSGLIYNVLRPESYGAVIIALYALVLLFPFAWVIYMVLVIRNKSNFISAKRVHELVENGPDDDIGRTAAAAEWRQPRDIATEPNTPFSWMDGPARQEDGREG